MHHLLINLLLILGFVTIVEQRDLNPRERIFHKGYMEIFTGKPQPLAHIQIDQYINIEFEYQMSDDNRHCHWGQCSQNCALLYVGSERHQKNPAIWAASSVCHESCSICSSELKGEWISVSLNTDIKPHDIDWNYLTHNQLKYNYNISKSSQPWHHVHYIITPTERILFVDQIEISRYHPDPGSNFSNSQYHGKYQLWLGAPPSTPYRTFHANIRDLGIYSGATPPSYRLTLPDQQNIISNPYMGEYRFCHMGKKSVEASIDWSTKVTQGFKGVLNLTADWDDDADIAINDVYIPRLINSCWIRHNTPTEQTLCASAIINRKQSNGKDYVVIKLVIEMSIASLKMTYDYTIFRPHDSKACNFINDQIGDDTYLQMTQLGSEIRFRQERIPAYANEQKRQNYRFCITGVSPIRRQTEQQTQDLIQTYASGAAWKGSKSHSFNEENEERTISLALGKLVELASNGLRAFLSGGMDILGVENIISGLSNILLQYKHSKQIATQKQSNCYPVNDGEMVWLVVVDVEYSSVDKGRKFIVGSHKYTAKLRLDVKKLIPGNEQAEKLVQIISDRYAKGIAAQLLNITSN